MNRPVQLAFDEALTERERILDRFLEDHPAYFQALRAFGREIALRKGSVTVDDVVAECLRRDFPLPNDLGLDNRMLGSLFRCRDFKAVDSVPTSRREKAVRFGVNRSRVTVYRLAQ